MCVGIAAVSVVVNAVVVVVVVVAAALLLLQSIVVHFAADGLANNSKRCHLN